MSKNVLQTNQQKIEEMKRKRMERMNQLSSNTNVRTQNISAKREFSSTRSETIQIASSSIETYQKEVQCAFETRSLESRPTIQEQDDESQFDVDLLQPKQHKKRKDEHRKGDHELHSFKPKQLTEDELQSLVKSKNFNQFFNRSSKFLQKVLDHGDSNMIEMLLNNGLKTKQTDSNVLAHVGTFSDPNFTNNRVLTDLDWSTQIPELFLASYSQNESGNIKDHVGVVLVWTPSLRTRPQFYCFCQSAVTTAKFFPFSNSTIIGGCYNGQLLIWDFRIKAMPVQRSGISADGHKYPVNSLNIVGTQIANNVVSFSNDGTMCVWDVKQFSKPIKNSTKFVAHRPTRNVKPVVAQSLARTTVTASSILERKQETHDVNVSCCQFSIGDANKYYVGSLNGAMYKNAIHNSSVDKISMYDEHEGAISSISINNPSSEHHALSGLILTSSFDWTVKLWSPNDHKQSIRTFEHSDDYIYDVAWNPVNPSIFATVNNEGSMDLFDLTKDMEKPTGHVKINSNAQNKCRWNSDGSIIASGDSSGNISLLVLNEKLRRMENSSLEDFDSILAQNKEQL